MTKDKSKVHQALTGVNGQLSSKRIAFLGCFPFVIGGTLYFTNKLIVLGSFQTAIEMWNSFLLTSCVFGGFVASEVLKMIVPNNTKNTNNSENIKEE